MKTAISIPDKLFKNAELTAKKLGISRSSLFSLAIKEYLESYNPTNVTEKLNNIYKKESSKIDADILQMQISSLNREDW